MSFIFIENVCTRQFFYSLLKVKWKTNQFQATKLGVLNDHTLKISVYITIITFLENNRSP